MDQKMMDLGLRTPLIEAFKRPDVPVDVRLAAALGHLDARPIEQLALLVLLADDEDASVRSAAQSTLDAMPPERIAGALASPDAPQEMVRAFADRGVVPASDTTWTDHAGGDDTWDAIADADGVGVTPDVERQRSVTQTLQQMTIVQRVNAAMKGSREVRALLVRDPNRMVASAVLSSTKLTLAEVEAFAKMTNVSEDVLRAIGQNRAWVKSYAVAHGLARNPKTPVALTMTLLQRINDRDVKALSVDRNVPEPVRVAARKRFASAQQR